MQPRRRFLLPHRERHATSESAKELIVPLSGPLSSAAPTSLLNHPGDGSSTNCLALAARFARLADDDIVFLSPAPHAETAGHVVLCHRRSGAVREPDRPIEEPSAPSMHAYLEASGRRQIARLPSTVVSRLLRLPPQRRLIALAALGAPFRALADLQVGACVPPPCLSGSPVPDVAIIAAILSHPPRRSAPRRRAPAVSCTRGRSG
jgi:hypothetical protein